jgi:hypothetical protein
MSALGTVTSTSRTLLSREDFGSITGLTPKLQIGDYAPRSFPPCPDNRRFLPESA